jgi:hypothetical protein
MTSDAEAWLVDDRWGKAYPVTDDTTIGRGSKNAIIVRDPAVSRYHAVVRRNGATYALEVMGESGTLLNGTPVIGRTVLTEGDTIDVAITSLRFTTRAPTGEMFVVTHDYPALGRETPTRPTLHAMHPITLYSRSGGWVRKHWHFVVGAAFLVTVLALCAN